jgi:anti-sigma regulatory factor (Ser/Thr protein kinase)
MALIAPALQAERLRFGLGAALRRAVRRVMACHELSLAPELSEIARLIDWAEACCDADGIGGEIRFGLVLALEEAVANLMNHAFDGVTPPHLISLRLDISNAAVVAEITDNGRAFDPTAVPEPDLSLPLEQRDPGGLGILLMREMMDRVVYCRSSGNNILRLEKART